MTVKKCDLEDVGYVCKMWNDFVELPWKAADIVTAFNNPDYIFLDAEEEGIPKGFVCASKILDEAEVCGVAVLPGSRRCGVASCLIGECLKKLKEQNIKTVFLEVNETNQAAIKLYLKSGFTEVYRRKKYYGENAAVIMELKI